MQLSDDWFGWHPNEVLPTVFLVSEPVKARGYRSTLRAEQARARREAILVAAHGRFLADGYPNASIASIAMDAGVSEDLVYLHFRNKRGLLVEVLNFVVTGEPDSPPVLEQRDPLAMRDEPDQRRQIAMFAHDVAHRVDRARPVDDVLRSAAEVDVAVAEKYASMHRERLSNLTQVVHWIAGNGPLRDDLAVDEAACTVWALASPAMHRMLVENLGWDVDRYAAWLERTLEAVLLPPDDHALRA
jgi:AcrR family transcriptional regulator